MFLTIEQTWLHAQTVEYFEHGFHFVEKVRFLHSTGKLRMSGIRRGEPYDYPINSSDIFQRGEIMPSVWNDFYLDLNDGGYFTCMDPQYECVEIRDVRVNPDNVFQIWPNRKAVQISGKTKRERVTSYLRQTYGGRPEDMTVKEIHLKIIDVPSLRRPTKRDVEWALKVLGWTRGR